MVRQLKTILLQVLDDGLLLQLVLLSVLEQLEEAVHLRLGGRRLRPTLVHLPHQLSQLVLAPLPHAPTTRLQ